MANIFGDCSEHTRLYVGITREFQARVFKDKNKWYEGSLTARYRFDILVYFEAFFNPSEAIGAREGDQRLAAGEEAAVDPGAEPGLG